MSRLYKILDTIIGRTKQKGQYLESSSANIAANTYIDKTISIGTDPDGLGRTPILRGWNISGTGTSSVQCMGAYIGGDDTSGFTAHIKIKNDSSSQIGPVTAVVWIAWIYLGG